MPDRKRPGPGEAVPIRSVRSGAASPGGRRAGAGCPICGRPPLPEQRPFCSARCRQIDLSHWLTGHYSIPGETVGETEPED